MKLIDVLKNVVKSNANSTSIDSTTLCSIFNLNSFDIDYDKLESKLKAYWIKSWLCTDTWVGYSVMYLEDKLVGYTEQVCRKCDYNIRFIDCDCFEKVRLWAKDCSTESYSYCIISDLELNTEISSFTTIEFTSQLLRHLDGQGFYNDKPCTFVKVFPSKDYLEKNIIIRVNETNEELIIPIKKFKFPIHVKGLWTSPES